MFNTPSLVGAQKVSFSDQPFQNLCIAVSCVDSRLNGDCAQVPICTHLTQVSQNTYLLLLCHTHTSSQAAKQYESTLRIQQVHTKVLLSSYLRTRLSPPTALKSLHYSHVLPDIESSILSVSRSLLPVVHKLKWSIQKDNMSRIVRAHTFSAMNSIDPPHPFNGGFGVWAELRGSSIFGESERVRLALCPDVRKMIKFYEEMA